MRWRRRLLVVALVVTLLGAGGVLAQQVLVGRVSRSVQQGCDEVVSKFLGGLLVGDVERVRSALGEALWVAYDSPEGVHEARMMAAEEFVGATKDLQARLRVEEDWERQHKSMSDAALIPMGGHLFALRRWLRWKEMAKEMIRHDEIIIAETPEGWQVVGFISGAPVPLN